MGTWFWIILGVLAVALLGASGKKAQGKENADNRRIDHLHYIELDEYECPKCHARFRRNVMACPKCGARFSGTKEDDEEFIEEMVLWDDDD